MGFEGIGASVRRKEDHRFLSGNGNYTDDINRPGQLYAVIRRADRPHARLLGIDAAAARAAPGVVAVYTGADMQAAVACPAAGRSTTRMARQWRSRRIRCSRSARSGMSAIPLPS